MLTGRETVAALAAATGHRHRAAVAVGEVLDGAGGRPTTWGQLLPRVRHVALGLADAGLGAGTALPLPVGATVADRAVAFLAAAAAGAVLHLPGERSPATEDRAGPGPGLAALAATGAAIDERDPGRYEALVAAQDPGAVLVRVGGIAHTHTTLLVAACSLSQGARLGPASRLLVDLPPGVAGVVAGLVLPCLAATPVWSLAPAVGVDDGLAVVAPTLALVSGGPGRPGGPGAPGAPGGRRAGGAGARPPVPVGGRAGSRRRPSRRRSRGRPPRCQVVAAVGVAGPVSSPGPGGVAGALVVDAAGGIVAAFGPPGSLGRPLPGVSLAIDDDGAVLVRARAMAPGAPGLRPDGWLPVGSDGRLEGGALFLLPSVPAPAPLPAGP